MRVAMQKVEGVKSVTVSLKEGVTVLELQEGNAVTLARIRTEIKNNGFVSKDAIVTARGAITGTTFEVRGTGEQLPLTKPPVSRGADTWQLTSPAVR